MVYKDNPHYKLLNAMFTEKYLQVYRKNGLWKVQIDEDEEGAFCATDIADALEAAWETVHTDYIPDKDETDEDE